MSLYTEMELAGLWLAENDDAHPDHPMVEGLVGRISLLREDLCRSRDAHAETHRELRDARATINDGVDEKVRSRLNEAHASLARLRDAASEAMVELWLEDYFR